MKKFRNWTASLGTSVRHSGAVLSGAYEEVKSFVIFTHLEADRGRHPNEMKTQKISRRVAERMAPSNRSSQTRCPVTKFIALSLLAACLLISSQAVANGDEETAAPAKTQSTGRSVAGNFTVGLGPVGNIYIVDSNPQLGPGVGGYVFFDYRWSPQFSTQFGVLVTTEDGTGPQRGDSGIEFLGIPTFDLKFYVLSNPSRWDPYGLVGFGVYAVTEGGQSNGTKAVGVGADIGIGTDFYVSEKFSVGLAAVFRSIGLIDSTNSPNNGTALFPFSMMGNIAYHF